MRPRPPDHLLEITSWEDAFIRLAPARDVLDWVRAEILAESGSIHNPDHAHLVDADIEFMWASTAFTKKGRTVIGEAEQVTFRAGGWQRARQEQQMREWFGRVPNFVITLAADYCADCSDAEFCALVEHELYHIVHALDQYGAPRFTQDGIPKFELRGHDVEEFIGVVRRYGASREVQAMAEAAMKPAEVATIDIARACGTCLLKSA